jgi:hypothetical protein
MINKIFNEDNFVTLSKMEDDFLDLTKEEYIKWAWTK